MDRKGLADFRKHGQRKLWPSARSDGHEQVVLWIIKNGREMTARIKSGTRKLCTPPREDLNGPWRRSSKSAIIDQCRSLVRNSNRIILL
jgi:hypothetical protein